MKHVVAHHFTNDDKSQATILLEGQKDRMSGKDISIISFLMGVNITMMIMLFILVKNFVGDSTVT